MRDVGTRSCGKLFTSRVHKQHTSLVVTVPRGVCNGVGIERGSLLLWEVDKEGGKAMLSLVKSREDDHAGRSVG